MNIELMPLEDFYKNKRVLITGHTGFKGAWLTYWLKEMGAQVYGYSLDVPPSDFNTSLYEVAEIENDLEYTTFHNDIRNFTVLNAYMDMCKPQIIFHLAAQPIVSEGYANPRDTYEINVMGTINVLQAARNCSSVESIAIITTDKVYNETKMNQTRGYSEDNELNGYDPYSNSKSCADLATQCYINCYMKPAGIPVSIFRAGNVIGGGDFAKNRIVPDFIKAWSTHNQLVLRSPYSVRPYQHVLEPLYIYLTIAMNQALGTGWDDIYNIGPDANNCVTTECLIQSLSKYFDKNGNASYAFQSSEMKESKFLKLDCSYLKSTGWAPVWDIDTTAEAIYRWYDAWNNNPKDTVSIRGIMHNQIERYLKDVRK